MSDRRTLKVTIPVARCRVCGGTHSKVRFVPSRRGPTPQHTHRGRCPAFVTWADTSIWLDTYARPGAWERMVDNAVKVKRGN